MNNSNSGSVNALNGDKILKVNFQNSSQMLDSDTNKSHTVTFGEMPVVVKVTPATSTNLTIPMDEELHDQS